MPVGAAIVSRPAAANSADARGMSKLCATRHDAAHACGTQYRRRHHARFRACCANDLRSSARPHRIRFQQHLFINRASVSCAVAGRLAADATPGV